MAGTKRSCCNRFCCFSSSASDEEGQDHPASAGPRSSLSAIVNTTGPPKRSEAPIPGSSNFVTPWEEIEQHVDPNLDVSRTHQCDKAPLSESQNILRKSEGEDVNAHPNVSGATQCDEPSSSGSSNVPVKSEGEHVDVNPNVSEAETLPGPPKRSEAPIPGSSNVVTPMEDEIEQHVDPNLDVSGTHHYDKAPLSESQNILRKSEGEDVNAHLNVSGFPQCDEPSSSGPSNVPVKPQGEHVDVNPNVSEAPSSSYSSGATESDVIRSIKHIGQADGKSQNILRKSDGEGQDHPASAGLRISHSEIEGTHSIAPKNSEARKCEVEHVEANLNVSGPPHQCDKAPDSASLNILQKFENENVNINQNVSGDPGCSGTPSSSSPSGAKKSDQVEGKGVDVNLDESHQDLSMGSILRRMATIQSMRNPPVNRIYPEHAVGIDESIKEVLSLLEIESDDHNAVTVILHGFGGMGKTTLADAVVSKDTVVSKLVGFKFSKVRMREDSVIVNLQKEILEDLMEPRDLIPEIRTYEDGQRELRERLKQVQACIYIDNVLDRDALKKLLPVDMTTAKKVRLLLTARNEDVKNACPRPKIYKMQKIQPQAALTILKREIKDGINDNQFNDIIDTCGGIPLMLTVTAKLIGRAVNKEVAYSTQVLQKNKWPSEAFVEMRYACAFDALPRDCIEPFLDICSYFKGWDWETVEAIVGKHKLEMLERRAFVTRTANDVAFVHDVILTLAHQKSREDSEGEEVRLAFTSASKLTEFLEEEGAEGIKGIWLSDNKDDLEISAATLDLMSKSLRVLRLGDLENVKGQCKKTFKELVFFEAKVRQLPFHDLSKLKKLRYVSYVPNDDLKLSKMPSSLRHVEFDGTSLSDAFEIDSDDLQELKHLRILRLLNFYWLKNLPKKLGDQVKGLHELSLSNCISITKLPDSISKLQSLRILKMDRCSSLTELPVDFGSLISLRELSFKWCHSLKKLPDSFGQLASLKVLLLKNCESLQKLPESFGQLKNLEVLDLGGCDDLRELCNDFHCLSSLQNLDLSYCLHLEKLPLDFHCLTSLQRLDLSDCEMLEGKSMDHVVKMNRLQLQVVHIKRSKQLVARWAEIQRDGGGSWSFTVISGQDLSVSRVEKENIENSLLLELDGLLTNRRGEQFHLSPLPPNTLILVLWDLQPYILDWRDFIEEMIDETQIKMIYIGPDFDKFSTKVKDNIFVVDVPTTRAAQMHERVHLTLDLAPDPMINKCLQIDTRMQAGDEYRPCWRLLRRDEMEEFVVSNCKRYLRLKQLQVERDEELERDEESSNIELLTELFAPQGDERTPVFQKNESSVQQDPTANSEVKATCGVDKLEGKTILLEMRPPDSFSIDIRLPSLKEMYLLEKERLNFEIISIPLLRQGEVSSDVFDVYKQFSREVPWLVLRTTITREVQYFLAKHCTESKYECEKCYPSINWVIDPNGRITIYRPPISPGDMRDRGEVFKVFFNYLESQSYQLRWGVKAPLTTLGKIEEVRKNEWQQVKNMSALEFLFNHLESVSVQVKSLMRQGKFICFFAGSCYGEPWSMRSAMEQFRDSIHFINVSYIVDSFRFDSNIDKEYYYPLENTSEMEGTSLLNLSRHETVRFIMRLHHLKEEIKGMDLSDKQLCELKTILHSLLFRRSFTFFNEVGKMVGALEGEKINSIFYPADRRDKVQRLINLMLKEGGKEMHDEDSSLIRKIHTASASAVEQQNADVYFDALRDYISHLWGVQLYQLCKFNQEGKKRSPPRVTWPTWSRGLGRLKNLLSEGANEDWVKDVISRHSEEDEEDALDTVIKCLVQDIEEAEWAVAGLLAVADLLERFETVPPSSREEWLFVLEEMFRLAQYSKQFNQKAELWRRMKCGAIVVILRYSIICCRAIDPSKFEFAFAFALGRWEGSSADEWLEEAEKDLREECDTLAQTMTEDPDNESGSLANLDCYKLGFDLWPEGEGEGGPSSEYKRSASCPCPDLCFPDLWLESEGEGGLSSEYKRSASCPCPDLCFPDLWLESEEEGGPSESEEEGEDEGGPSEGEDEGGPSSEYKRSASFPELWLESEDEGGPSSE